MNEKDILNLFDFEQQYMDGKELYCKYLGVNHYVCAIFTDGEIESMGISKNLYLLIHNSEYFKETYNKNKTNNKIDFKNELLCLIRDCGIEIGKIQRNEEIKNLLDIK